MRKKSIWLVIAGVFLIMCTSYAQEIAVPVNLQYTLFLKILMFDKNLTSRPDDEIVIGIIYQKKFRTSYNIKNELVDVVNQSPIKMLNDVPIRMVCIDIEESDLLNSISIHNPDLLYITPLRAVEIKMITAICRTQKILTLTGVPDFVESGLSVGINIKGGKPQIMINLNAAKEEGANFSSQLLNIATVVQ